MSARSPRSAVAFCLFAFLVSAFFAPFFAGCRSRDASDLADAWRALRRAGAAGRSSEARLSGMEFHVSGTPSAQAALGAPETVVARLAERARAGDFEARRALAWRSAAAGDFIHARREMQRLSRRLDAAPLAVRADFHNDFGVVLYEIAKIEHDVEAFDQALREFGRALADAPDHREARFNRATLFQRLSLVVTARAEWDDYLKRDAESAWATEARARRAASDRPPQTADALKREFDRFFEAGKLDAAQALVSENLATLCNYALEDLLDRHLAGTPADARARDAADFIGGVARAAVGDRAVSDAVAGVRGAGDRAKLIAARAAMKRGRALFPPQGKPVEAQAEYEAARALFAEAGDAYGEAAARLGAAYCLIRSVETPPIQRAKDQATEAAQARGYYGLLAQLDRFQAQLALRTPDYAGALAHCDAALKKFRALHDHEEIQKTLLIAGDAYHQEGQVEKAFAAFQELLAVGEAHGTNPRRRAQACNYAATLCVSVDALCAARAYAQESLESAKGESYSNFRRRSHSLLAIIEARSGSSVAAESLARAQAALNETPDPRDRATQQIEFDQTSAECHLLLGDARAAQAACEDALTRLSGGGNKSSLARLQELHGSALFQVGDIAGAERAFRESVAQLESERAGIPKTQDRQYFLHRRATVYDRLAALTFSQKSDVATAFEFAERAKARTLLDEISASAPAALPAAAVRTPRLGDARARLPHDMQILAYAVTDDAVFGWSFTKDRVMAHAIPIAKAEMERRITAFVETVSDPETPLADARAHGAELYRLLIAPFESSLDASKTLCIIPDKALHFAPWAALVEPAGGWLAERYALATAPSVAVLLERLRVQSGKPASAHPSLAAVGDPTFDAAEFPKLQPLDHARDEVRCVAQTFARSRILVGSEATKAAFFDSIADAETIHVAAHCVIDRRHPLRSALALAKDGAKDDGGLSGADIYALTFPKTRLLVLSACESGLGAYFNGEGVFGIAHPFLARGVPTLVASLWNVDDRATRELMCEFYRVRRRENAPPARALRAAQLFMLKRPGGEFVHPSYWADFLVIGAPN
jgi:CHAT domain-containing protein